MVYQNLIDQIYFLPIFLAILYNVHVYQNQGERLNVSSPTIPVLHDSPDLWFKISCCLAFSSYCPTWFTVVLCICVPLNLIITPQACARGKVISLSVCCCRCCPQKTGIFWDLQVQASREWHKTQNRQKKLAYLCSYLLLTIHECNKSWFLYTMPIRHTYWGYSVMRCDCACPSSV